MLSILCVRLKIKIMVGMPESFKVEWYPPPPKKNWVESPYVPYKLSQTTVTESL